MRVVDNFMPYKIGLIRPQNIPHPLIPSNHILISHYKGCSNQIAGPTGNSQIGGTKCWHCNGSYERPKVLHECFHTFCEPCLEKLQDHPEKITCPQCHSETMLGNAGTSGLLTDFGIFGIMERFVNIIV